MEVEVAARIEALSARSFVTGFSFDAERLSALDDMWTAYLSEEHETLDLQRDFPALQKMVGEIIMLLSSLVESSRELEQLVIEFPSDLDRELELLLESHPARDWLLENRPPEPLAENVVEACRTIRQEAPGAILELAEKLNRLAADEFTPGDFPQRLKCAVVMAGAGATILAACAGPGALIALPAAVLAGAGIGGGIASGIAAIKGWSCYPPGPEPAAA